MKTSLSLLPANKNNKNQNITNLYIKQKDTIQQNYYKQHKIGRSITQLSNHPRVSQSNCLNQNKLTHTHSNKITQKSTVSQNNLKNFTKKQLTSQTYIKQFNALRKSSFLFNNRLTKSVFDITDAAMIGKPQNFRDFKSARGYYTDRKQTDMRMMKSAVRKITGQQQGNEAHKRKSLIPQVYQKAFSLSNISLSQQPMQRNTSLDKSFFPTTTKQPKTQFQISSTFKKASQLKERKTLSFTQDIRPKILQKQKNALKSTSQIRLSKPSSERKIRNINNKLQQLQRHNQSIIKLMPVPIVKPQKIVIKGRGEMISQQKITRVIDKLLSVLELYFQMYEQNGERVMDFMKNVEGFDNEKLREIFCDETNNNSVTHIASNQHIMKHFWGYQSLKAKQNQQFQLPQFYGEEDYALYKLLNNFCLKLQSKYQNTHRDKFKKIKEMKASNETSKFDDLLKQSTTLQAESNKKNAQFSQLGNNQKNSQMMSHSTQKISFFNNQHLDRKLLLAKIKYNPLNSDRKISNQMQELQDLGVKFDFRQKGKSIILAEKSEILYKNR